MKNFAICPLHQVQLKTWFVAGIIDKVPVTGYATLMLIVNVKTGVSTYTVTKIFNGRLPQTEIFETLQDVEEKENVTFFWKFPEK